MERIQVKDGAVHVRVRVQPRASRDAVTIGADGRIRIALTAPPVEGEANDALCAFIAKRVGAPKRAVSVVSGMRCREKVLRVEGIDVKTFEVKLLA